jgi:hypothetical protein
MRNVFLFALLSSMVVFVTLLNCSAKDRSPGADENDSILVVEPAIGVSLGYFEEQVFKVRLENSDGTSMAGEPIFASFTEPAHNAHLEPSEFYTDGNGMGNVVFTAPDQPAAFPIHFTSPTVAEPTVVNIIVDPSLLKISLQIDYLGEREFDTIEASIYEETICQNLLDGYEQEPLEVREIPSLPASLDFWGLRANRTYAVQVAGANQYGEIRALVCKDELIPNEDEPVINIEDVPFEFSGNYSITTTIETDGALASTVDELAAASDGSGFISNPATAILDALKSVLIENDPLLEEPFDKIRTDNNLDERLKYYFSDNSINVPVALDPIWLSTKDYLKVITAYGILEFGSPDEGLFPTSHRIKEISFSTSNESDEPTQIDTSDSEAGIGTAERDGSNGDLIRLNKHKISLELGTLVYNILVAVGFEKNFETQNLREVLEKTVKCDQVADFLLQWLSEITNKPTIESGCKNATLNAEQKLIWGVPELDEKYRDLTFEGICELDEPSTGNQVQSLVNGTSQVAWEGVSFSGEDELLGPMEAVFEAELSNGQ